NPLGFEAIEAEWNGHDEVLRLYIDRVDLDEGVGMDDCVSCSKALDEIPLISGKVPGEYALEVSSPGVERPLRRAQDFDRYKGHEIFVQFSSPVEGRRKGHGTLVDIDMGTHSVQLEWGDRRGKGDILEFDLASLSKAYLVYSWK
ncbi:MAG: hypothetical protein OXT67_04145, partial [Zetaproteobacteria bacterium]|nr:hypothetical protein [Zetaproteobacteria bacterium]